MRRTCLLLAAAIAACALSATASGATFAGSWTKKIAGGPAPLHGSWALHVGSGKFYVQKLPAAGHAVDGTVAVSGSTITFTDRSGPLACGGATKVGRYTRKAGPNGSFRLTAVKDACAGRKLLLTSGAWNQKK